MYRLICSFLIIGASLVYAKNTAPSISFDIKDRNLARGEKLFSENCASCHVGRMDVNSTSFAVNPRNLELSLLSPEQMYHIINNGTAFYGSKTDYMIGYENIYTSDEIKDIVAYIHTNLNVNYKEAKKLYQESEKLSKDKSKEDVLEEGRKVYLKRCIHCHGPSGKADGVAVKASNGNLFPYDLTKTLLTDEQMFLFTKYGSKHWGASRDDMPAWGSVYSDEAIHSVVEYIKVMVEKSSNTSK